MNNATLLTTELWLPVPAQHACYADHFPNDPLVPGALLLKWILALIQRECAVNVVQLKQIKFMAPIKPSDNVRLMLAIDKAKQQIALDAFVGETPAIKGSLVFSLTEPAHG